MSYRFEYKVTENAVRPLSGCCWPVCDFPAAVCSCAVAPMSCISCGMRLAPARCACDWMRWLTMLLISVCERCCVSLSVCDVVFDCALCAAGHVAGPQAEHVLGRVPGRRLGAQGSCLDCFLLRAFGGIPTSRLPFVPLPLDPVVGLRALIA